VNSAHGGPNHVHHEAGLRQHRDVAAVDSSGGGSHALREEALQIGLNRPVAAM
jgi:hypothetical protein